MKQLPLACRLLLPLTLAACGGPRERRDGEPAAPVAAKRTLTPLALPAGEPLPAIDDCAFQLAFVGRFLAAHAPTFSVAAGRCQRFAKAQPVTLPDGAGSGRPCLAKACWLASFTVAGEGLVVPMWATATNTYAGFLSTADSAPVAEFYLTEVDATLYAKTVADWRSETLPLIGLSYRATLDPLRAPDRHQ